MKALVFVSVGEHPVSGRSRRSLNDARAIALALATGAEETKFLHVGDPDAPALTDYLGMGIPTLDVIDDRESSFGVSDLILSTIGEDNPDLLFFGSRTEQGERTGLLPYSTAEKADMRIVSEVGDLRIQGQELTVTRLFPGGRRQVVATSAPCVLVASPLLMVKRAVVFHHMHTGRIRVSFPRGPKGAHKGEKPKPNRRSATRPRRLLPEPRGSDRLAAMLGDGGTEGKQVAGQDPEVAARAVYDWLLSHRIYTPKG